jgi:hypothetical protein
MTKEQPYIIPERNATQEEIDEILPTEVSGWKEEL